MAKIRKKDNLSYTQGKTLVKFRMDRSFLLMIILYLFTDSRSITRSNLQAIKKFFEITDVSMYMANVEMYTMIIFIKKVLDCKLLQGIERKEIILEECRLENDEETDKIIELVLKEKKLSLNEIKAVNKQIADRLKYATLLYYNEIIMDIAMRVDTGKFKSFEAINNEYKNIISACLNEMRKSENNSASETFCLREDTFDSYITALVNKVTNPERIFGTGIKYLNDMLSPGFAPGRLYLFLGITGGYKSSILLQCARWIKLYNKAILKRKDPLVATPTVLLITTENSVEETVVRLFNMSVSDKPINEYTPEEAIKQLRTTGKLVLKETNDTDICIMYYANNELDTSDLYGIIEDLEDDNREVIALIFDYIKRIRPTEPASDERLQLKNVSNELKTLAIRLDIPVITANQINRAGNMAIDAAAGEGKEDLARLLGRANIAVSWDLLENVDWAAIINIEREKRTGILYLTIKRIKIRYKDLARYSYINHPFVDDSTIRLIDDVNLQKPLSKESLSSDMEGVSMIGSKGNMSVAKRDIVTHKRNEVSLSEFDFSKALSGSD